MNKISKLVKKVLGLISGTGFFGIALILYALLAWFFVKGYIGNALAWAFIGAFVGKNAQAIKEKIGGTLPPDDDDGKNKK